MTCLWDFADVRDSRKSLISHINSSFNLAVVIPFCRQQRQQNNGTVTSITSKMQGTTTIANGIGWWGDTDKIKANKLLLHTHI